MLWKKPASKSAPTPPVRHTPPGVEPRGLPSNRLRINPDAFPAELAAQESLDPLSAAPAPVVERDWDFALPQPPPPKEADPLLNADANWRHQAGLRIPLDPDALREGIRDRFSDNWERLASEPPRTLKAPGKAAPLRSPLTRWMFTNGRFDIAATAGPLLLLVLLIAGVIYGSRLLQGGTVRSPPSGESPR